MKTNMTLHDIIQKNSEMFDEKFPFAILDWKPDPRNPNSLKEWDGVTTDKMKEIKTHLLSSQLSIIQAIDEMIEEVIKNKEQVHGFQTYHTCDEECEVNCKRLRDERKIFFDGWDDGRDLMKIDLMRIRSFLNTKTKLQ